MVTVASLVHLLSPRTELVGPVSV